MNVDTKQLRITGITLGLLLGAALTILSIVSFYLMLATSSPILISAIPFLFAVLLPIILVVILCFNFRKKIGGFWNMRQAVTGIFIMFFVAFAVQFLIRDQFFARIIEPEMIQKTENAMETAVTAFLEKSKSSQELIDQQIDKIHKEFESQKNLSIGKQIQSVGISIIFMFVIAVIFGAFFKKESNVYNPDIDAEEK